MINFLSGWIEQIALAVIIASIFELILPNGNLKKYIKIILGIYVMFCMISPFVNHSELFDFENFKVEDYVQTSIETKSETVNQESMDRRLQQLYIDELEKDIGKKVEEHGYKASKINVDADLQSSSQNPGIHKIELTVSSNQENKIDIEKVDINSEKTQKDNTNEEIEGLRGEIADYYEVNKEIINIKLK